MNAQLLVTYLHAYKATGQAPYRGVAEEIIDYTDRVMSDRARGGFYAHQDADMRPGDHGAYYTWTVAEVQAALPSEAARVILRHYGLTESGNMPATPGRTVPGYGGDDRPHRLRRGADHPIHRRLPRRRPLTCEASDTDSTDRGERR